MFYRRPLKLLKWQVFVPAIVRALAIGTNRAFEEVRKKRCPTERVCQPASSRQELASPERRGLSVGEIE